MFEIYVSTDVETDGPVAGKHSILSIGSAAYTAEKELLSTFSANLETLPNAPPDSKTAAWWLTQPEAWSACRQNLEPACDAICALCQHRAGQTVLQYAESQSRGRLTESPSQLSFTVNRRGIALRLSVMR